VGGLRFLYFPIITGSWTLYSVSIFAVYLALCAMPLIINVCEDRKWRIWTAKT
jgi:hypothetical protein